MKTDTLFYEIFRRWPALALDLAGLDPAAAPRYVFRAEEIKQTAFRLDGLLAPPDEGDEPWVFVEVQFQPDESHYRRLLGVQPPEPRLAENPELLNLIETILVYKLPRSSRAEVQAMLALTDIDLKQTRFYQDVLAEGRQEGRKEGRQEGRKEGRKEGRLEGRQEGLQEGEATLLLRQIQLKFGPPDSAVRQRIQTADADTLLRWSERILTATTLDETLAD